MEYNNNNNMECNKTILVKITSWEANGYDDSDWDTIYYNVNDKSIVHDPGTTRGYVISSLPANSEIISLEDALSSNIVVEKEVRDAFAKDTFKTGKVYLSYNSIYKSIEGLNWPVSYVLRANGKTYNGILLNTVYVSSRDWFGREVETTYAIIYNKILNKVIKTHLYNVTVPEEVKLKISDNFVNNASIREISSFVSYKNSCSRFSLDWVAQLVINFSKGLFEAPDINGASIEITKTRKPSKASYERAKGKVDAKSKQFRNWVNTLNETEEKREEIFNRTMNKYLSKELEIIRKYEEK